MKLLLFGANGQVGSEIVRLAQHSDTDLVAITRADVDITQQSSVRDCILNNKPSVVINAAAYTAVDKAEQERELARAVNATAPGYIATVCAQLQIPLLHISTDYVFDGSKADGYSEMDAVQPINVYGQTKLEGENQIRAQHTQHIILRTSWVFGAVGNNFVKTILRLAKERQQISVVNDQHGCPTPAHSIAATLLSIANTITKDGKPIWGTYHYCGSPPTTWYEFAQAIVAEAERCMSLTIQQVLPINTEAYPTPARRPQNSVLKCSKIQEQYDIQLPLWRAELQKMFATGVLS